MKVEEGEIKFGKRWSMWTPDENKEFVKAMTEENLGNPLCLRLMCENIASVPAGLWENLGYVLTPIGLVKK